MTEEVKKQLEEQQVKLVEEKKSVTARVKQERKEAIERRRSQEKEFIDHIQY
jgi:hypothetical protein